VQFERGIKTFLKTIFINRSDMEDIKLSDLFEDAYKLFESFDKREDPTNSLEFQVSESDM
jgi:hypothetical protein